MSELLDLKHEVRRILCNDKLDCLEKINAIYEEVK